MSGAVTKTIRQPAACSSLSLRRSRANWPASACHRPSYSTATFRSGQAKSTRATTLSPMRTTNCGTGGGRPPRTIIRRSRVSWGDSARPSASEQARRARTEPGPWPLRRGGGPARGPRRRYGSVGRSPRRRRHTAGREPAAVLSRPVSSPERPVDATGDPHRAGLAAPGFRPTRTMFEPGGSVTSTSSSGPTRSTPHNTAALVRATRRPPEAGASPPRVRTSCVIGTDAWR